MLEFENATVTYDKEEPVFHGRMADGTPFDYDQVEPGIYMQKLLDALEALRTAGRRLCGVQADLPHIQAVRMVQQNPITPVRAELIEPTELNGDTFYFVRGLEQTLADCAARWGAAPGSGGRSGLTPPGGLRQGLQPAAGSAYRGTPRPPASPCLPLPPPAVPLSPAVNPAPCRAPDAAKIG